MRWLPTSWVRLSCPYAAINGGSADPLAGGRVKNVQALPPQSHADGITLLAVEILRRLHRKLVMPDLYGDQRVIADQLGGVDHALQASVFRSNHRAILRPHSQDRLIHVPADR